MKTNKYINQIKSTIKSVRGKKFLQYTLFVFVSFIFWFALTLNEEFRYEIKYPIKISNLSDSITLISNVPKEIKVNINAKGYNFLKNKFKAKQHIDIDFNKYNDLNCLRLGFPELHEIITATFGGNSQATSISPDSINIYYTNKPGKTVRLKINADANPANQYIINAPISSNTKTVTIYSLTNIPSDFTTIETESIKCNNLKNTTTIKAKVNVPFGMKSVPDSVDITIPIEPLLSKKRIFNINVVNTPNDRRLIIFPSQVELNYLIPKSLFNNEIKSAKVIVDYNDIAHSPNKLPIKIIDIPDNYKSTISSIDSVEYIIEQ